MWGQGYWSIKGRHDAKTGFKVVWDLDIESKSSGQVNWDVDRSRIDYAIRNSRYWTSMIFR